MVCLYWWWWLWISIVLVYGLSKCLCLARCKLKYSTKLIVYCSNEKEFLCDSQYEQCYCIYKLIKERSHILAERYNSLLSLLIVDGWSKVIQRVELMKARPQSYFLCIDCAMGRRLFENWTFMNVKERYKLRKSDSLYNPLYLFIYLLLFHVKRSLARVG